MLDQLDLSSKQNLCDDEGHTIGVFLPTKTAQALVAERGQLRAEVDRLRTEVEELKRALDAARQEVSDKAALVAERDCYLRELEEFWAEKIADLDKNGVDLGDVIAEIEQDLRERGLLDAK